MKRARRLRCGARSGSPAGQRERESASGWTAGRGGRTLVTELVRAEVTAAIAKWRPRLRLMDWSISIRWDDADIGKSSMEGEIDSFYRRALVKVAPNPLDPDQPWKTVEKVVVHELVHILLEQPQDVLEESLNRTPNMGRREASELSASVRQANEYATEWVARVVWEAFEGTLWDSLPKAIAKDEEPG